MGGLVVKRFVVAVIVLIAYTSFATGQVSAPIRPDTSPLLKKGLLQEIRKPLETIFAFHLDGTNLKIDRNRWEAAGREQLKGAKDKKDKEEEPRNADEESGIEIVFLLQIESAGGLGGSSSSSGGGRRTYSFSGEKLMGRLHVQDQSVRMNLEEAETPRRTLEYADDGNGNLHIQVAHPDGDMVLFKQSQRGRCVVVAVIDSQVVAATGDCFLDVYRKHRREMDELVLPVLAHFGAEVLPPRQSPRVRQVVHKLLARTPETLAAGRKLLDDLDGGEFAARQQSRRLLSQKFETYQDLIEERLQGKPSLEIQAQLKKIVAENLEAARVGQAVAAMELLKDGRYLVSLLDHANAEESRHIVGRLEEITGQKLGMNPAAWREWANRGPK